MAPSWSESSNWETKDKISSRASTLRVNPLILHFFCTFFLVVELLISLSHRSQIPDPIAKGVGFTGFRGKVSVKEREKRK